MSNDKREYHLGRERHCRDMALHAADPDIRKKHEQLASLHARAAAPQAIPPV